jgi:hypothetical protein
MWSKVKPLPGAEELIRNLVAINIPIAVLLFCALVMVVGNIIPSIKIYVKNKPFTRELLLPLP